MIYAIENRKSNAISILVSAGADVNLTHNNESGGITPLMVATSNGMVSPSVVEVLLNAGADVNAQNDIYDSALVASIHSKERGDYYGAKIAEMLLNAGVKDDEIRNAIHPAKKANKPRILKILQEHIKKERKGG